MNRRYEVHPTEIRRGPVKNSFRDRLRRAGLSCTQENESANQQQDKDDDGTARSELGMSIVTPLIKSIQDDVMAQLDAITIEDLCQRARAAGVESGNGTSADFTI